MEVLTDPAELARAKVREERFRLNSAWLQDHITEVYSRHRGRCICVAGQELFSAENPEAALALANRAHPEDNGRSLRYISREMMARV